MGLFDKLEAWGITTPDVPAPVVEPVKPAPAPAPQSYPVQPGVASLNPELLCALLKTVNENVSPNNLVALTDMAETLKAAIVDEGTRIKAAAAALKLSYSDINGSIDAMIYQTTCEKNKFMSTDVAKMDQDIKVGIEALDSIKARIDEAIAQLNDLTIARDQMTAELNQKNQDRLNIVSTFEATADKVTSILQEECKRIQIYLPQVLTNGK